MSLLDKIRHARNQAKERARIAVKIKEAEDKRASGTLVIEDKPKTRTGMPSRGELEQMAMEQVGINSTEVSQENVRQACTAMSDLIHRQGNGKTRQQVMIHLPGEMRKVLVGRTSQEAYDFYWSIPQFQTVWKELGFNEQRLKDFVNAQSRLVGKDLL